jgi:sugar phosphate isomerase/epimerase
MLAQGPLTFHEPVWGVEHTAPRATPGWEESMVHLRLTRKYADILHPSSMVVHLNNCPVPGDARDRMLKSALERLDELRDMFPDVPLWLENTGTVADGTVLLDQAEFTDLCLARKQDVLIDVGHANANGWDIPRLLEDLKGRIRGFHLHNNDGVHDQHRRLGDGTIDFRRLLPLIRRIAPEANLVIEYTRPDLHGEPLCEDIAAVLSILREEPVRKGEKEDAE